MARDEIKRFRPLFDQNQFTDNKEVDEAKEDNHAKKETSNFYKHN